MLLQSSPQPSHTHPHPRSDLLPTLPTPTPPSAPSTHMGRNSLVALGVIIALVIGIALHYIYMQLRHARQRALQNQHTQDIERQPSIFSRKDSIWSAFSISRSRSGSTRSSTSLPASETPAQRERRWWGSVAAHGSTIRADREGEVFQPSIPSPRSNDAPGLYAGSGYDWDALKATERLDGFGGVVWKTETMGAGLDQGARVCEGRETEVEITKPARTRRISTF